LFSKKSGLFWSVDDGDDDNILLLLLLLVLLLENEEDRGDLGDFDEALLLELRCDNGSMEFLTNKLLRFFVDDEGDVSELLL